MGDGATDDRHDGAEQQPLLRCDACDVTFQGRPGDDCPRCGEPVGERAGLAWQVRKEKGYTWLGAWARTAFPLYMQMGRPFVDMRLRRPAREPMVFLCLQVLLLALPALWSLDRHLLWVPEQRYQRCLVPSRQGQVRLGGQRYEWREVGGLGGVPTHPPDDALAIREAHQRYTTNALAVQTALVLLCILLTGLLAAPVLRTSAPMGDAQKATGEALAVFACGLAGLWVLLSICSYRVHARSYLIAGPNPNYSLAYLLGALCLLEVLRRRPAPDWPPWTMPQGLWLLAGVLMAI